MNAIAKTGEDSVGFRRMRRGDLDAVMQNETRSYAFPWTRGIFLECLASHYHSWVMSLLDDSGEEKIIGHCVISSAAGEAHLLNVCVCRDFQGEGFGRQLVEYMIEVIRGLNASVVFLEVRPSNHVAIELYESLGFNEIGIRKNYYPAHIGQEDAKILALQLDLNQL